MDKIHFFEPWTIAGVGAALALSFAVWQGLGTPNYSWEQETAAARVNGVVISQSEFNLAIEAINKDRRGGATSKDRDRVLKNLIKEELLVQRSLELGLFESDRGVRKAVIDAMLQFAMLRGQGALEETELRQWYQTHSNEFSTASRYRVSVVSVRSASQAEKFAEILKTENFAQAAKSAIPIERYPIPNELLQSTKLKDYVGSVIVTELDKLESGDIAGPYQGATGEYVFVWLREKIRKTVPNFDDVKDAIAVQWKRQKEDRAVDEYITWLWEKADIETHVGILEP